MNSISTQPAPPQPSFFDRLQPVPQDSGFHMDGYWVWCGSAIKVGSVYHLFASRWPKDGPFPEGYRTQSEIVRATSDRMVGPYTFQEVVIGKRDPAYWDSNMAHNPTIHRIGDRYVLFYIGSDASTFQPNGKDLYRAVGYASAPAITGPWQRSKQPVIAQESNNPALIVEENGSCKLMFRDAHLRVCIASASDYTGPYTLQNDNVWPESKLEDFYLFKNEIGTHCICEDNVGSVSGHVRWGIHLVSADGVRHWHPYNPLIAYDHTIRYADGSVLQCTRRERPQLLFENGKAVGLFTAVYDGVNSWCQPVAIEPGYG